jgi:ferredoxin
MFAPEIFEQREEDGHSYVTLGELSAEMEIIAQRAADGCPEQAIIVEI